MACELSRLGPSGRLSHCASLAESGASVAGPAAAEDCTDSRQHRQLRIRSVRHHGHRLGIRRWHSPDQVAAVRPRSPFRRARTTCPIRRSSPARDGGPPPAGGVQPGAWYFNTCSTGSATGQATGVVWLATGQAAPTVPPPDPAVAGAQAASELQLPIPTLTLSPSTTGYVNLAEWLWINSSMWHSLSTTAQACNAGGCVTATATATPSYVTWNTGDGSTVTCNGPGTPYDPALPATAQSTTCSHTYATTSAGQPSPDGNPNDAAFPITATITWTVTWAGPDGSAGALPSLTTRGATSLKVAQIESVNN